MFAVMEKVKSRMLKNSESSEQMGEWWLSLIEKNQLIEFKKNWSAPFEDRNRFANTTFVLNRRWLPISVCLCPPPPPTATAAAQDTPQTGGSQAGSTIASSAGSATAAATGASASPVSYG